MIGAIKNVFDGISYIVFDAPIFYESDRGTDRIAKMISANDISFFGRNCSVIVGLSDAQAKPSR